MKAIKAERYVEPLERSRPVGHYVCGAGGWSWFGSALDILFDTLLFRQRLEKYVINYSAICLTDMVLIYTLLLRQSKSDIGFLKLKSCVNCEQNCRAKYGTNVKI